VKRGREAGGQIRPPGLSPDHVGERGRDVLTLEGAVPGEHLVQDDAERPDVGPLVHGLASRLLGRHVGGGAQENTGLGPGLGQGGRPGQVARGTGDGVARPRLGQAEVEDLHPAVGRELHVRGFQVAVDDALLVGLLETLGDLPGDRQRLVYRDGALLHALGQILTLDQLQDEEGLAVGLLEAVYGGDVGVVEGGEEVGLPLEPGQPLGVAGHLGRKCLEGDLAAELRVLSPVDLAHPPGPNGSQDLVGPQACPRRQRHAAALFEDAPGRRLPRFRASA